MITFPRLRRRRGGLHAADPLAAASPQHPPAPPVTQGITCSPDRCLNGIACYAPACYGTPGYSRADEPHGIATPETLAAIMTQAQAETARPAPEPGTSASLAPLWFGETFVDMFPSAPRRYVPPGARHPDPPRVRRLAPLPGIPAYAGLPSPVLAGIMSALRYPEYPGRPEAYAAVMRYVSSVTGTSSPYGSTSAWPSPAAGTHLLGGAA